MFCPNINDKNYQSLASVVGEARAHTIWNMNNGNPITLNSDGTPSKIYQALEQKYGEKKAIAMRAKMFSDEFMELSGITNNNTDIKPGVLELSEDTILLKAKTAKGKEYSYLINLQGEAIGNKQHFEYIDSPNLWKGVYTYNTTPQQKQQAQQLYSQYLESLNKSNTNPILKGNQQEQLKKFTELQERLNNKEFVEGAKFAFESSKGLQEWGTQEQYNNYIARVSLGIIKNPSNGEYNYNSEVSDIVYHGSDKIFDKFIIGEQRTSLTDYLPKGVFFSNSLSTANSYSAKHGKIYASIIGIYKPTVIQADKEGDNRLTRTLESAAGYIPNTGKTNGEILELVKNFVKNIKDNSDSVILKDVWDRAESSPFTPYLNTKFEREDYTNTYLVFDPEQIHILGSKQDIEGFKEFVNQPTLKSPSTQNIKPDVPELFESNPTLANAVYEALGFVSIKNSNNEFNRIINESKRHDLVEIAKTMVNNDISKKTKLLIGKFNSANSGTSLLAFEFQKTLSSIEIDTIGLDIDETILHEEIHRYTSALINLLENYKREQYIDWVSKSELLFIDRIKELYSIYSKNNGKLNINEFIAHGLTSEVEIKLLKSIKVGNESLFNKIINEILKVLGLNEASLHDLLKKSFIDFYTDSNKLWTIEDNTGIEKYDLYLTENEIKQAQQLYSQYLERNPNGTVEGFKEFVNQQNLKSPSTIKSDAELLPHLENINKMLKKMNYPAYSIEEFRNLDKNLQDKIIKCYG